MVGRDSVYQGKPVTRGKKRAEPKYPWLRQWWFRLLVLLLLAEMLIPFLQWPIGLPRVISAATEGAAALVVFIAFAHMMIKDKIPRGVWLILGIILIWGIVALFEGQSVGALAWGIWSLFKYPLVGLFAYLEIDDSKNFARWFIKSCIVLLAFQVGVQLVMYAMGYPISDDLAGTFGWRGVMHFTMLVFFVVCIGLGYWLATFDWKPLLLVLVLGLVGSTLNTTKFFLIGAALLAVTTLIIHLVRGEQFRQLFLFIFLVVGAAAVFVPIYNSVLVESQGLQPLQEFLEPDSIERYLFNDGDGDGDGGYNLGRGLAVTYAWQQIRRDVTTILFGYGLGTRTGSTVLGVSGSALEGDVYGGVGTTTLSTWMYEYGFMGLILFQIFNLWVVVKLFRQARRVADPYQAALAYGLILFTLFWPVWTWYHKAWIAGVMMILYWVAIGYTFRQIYQPPPPITTAINQRVARSR